MENRTETHVLQEPGSSHEKQGQLTIDNFHSMPKNVHENPTCMNSIVDLVWLKDQIIQQTVELETHVKACVETNTEATSEGDLKETIEIIEKELEDASVSFQNKSLMLHRLQVTHALREQAQEEDAEGKLIMQTINKSVELCSEIVANQKEIRTLENKVLEVQKQRLMLKQTMQDVLKERRTEKMKQQQLLQEMENELPKRAKKNLLEHLKTVTLIQNVLQGIILASGVNWAKDPKLKELILQLEKNPLD
ncbi:centromere protein H [Callorhinchus milii]|uniref:Centromere protein H-like protein n=1 Tax=Callorhinchus milii TaxID=7868 RepID=V9L3I7_CALMI|nr:centromere protein H [Callorhinchus milii]|eukprot:gi/632949656/ref/XP_007890285.1/ PREDICTED: centromere protein H [Callorhinchus milii]